AGREAHLVGAGGAARLPAEIDKELLVQPQPALFRVGVELEQERAALRDVRVELVVPAAEQRVGDVQALAVETELEHLRAAARTLAAQLRRLTDQAADPGPARQLRLRR